MQSLTYIIGSATASCASTKKKKQVYHMLVISIMQISILQFKSLVYLIFSFSPKSAAYRGSKLFVSEPESHQSQALASDLMPKGSELVLEKSLQRKQQHKTDPNHGSENSDCKIFLGSPQKNGQIKISKS